MIYLQSILTTDLVDGVSRAGDNSVTGWGIALLLSIAFNYFIYKEFKFIQAKLLVHMDMLTVHLENISNHISEIKTKE